YVCCCFFFQAEDGIRDFHVTGVQTCALPISLALGSGTVTPLELVSGFAVFANNGYRVEPFFIDRIEDTGGETIWMADYTLACLRSEERRVGKECRSRWSPER